MTKTALVYYPALWKHNEERVLIASSTAPIEDLDNLLRTFEAIGSCGTRPHPRGFTIQSNDLLDEVARLKFLSGLHDVPLRFVSLFGVPNPHTVPERVWLSIPEVSYV